MAFSELWTLTLIIEKLYFQNVIDGEKTIIQNPTEAQRKEHEKFDFEMHEVYAIDVLISSGKLDLYWLKLVIFNVLHSQSIIRKKKNSWNRR